ITSKNELKKAYQRQALSTHPDRNPNMPCAEKEFDEVNKSYKILTEYCEALEQANQKDNPILVRVRPDL
ncbi:MAG: DnaJ domain-containing protein, partial [Candidatus Omnitrophota bacterium]|nr:DnaJ domain-containing protein [Candidatus Omnitrophota bacterium]